MQRPSYPTETVLSNKITMNRIALSFKNSPRKPLRWRPRVMVAQESGRADLIGEEDGIKPTSKRPSDRIPRCMTAIPFLKGLLGPSIPSVECSFDVSVGPAKGKHLNGTIELSLNARKCFILAP